MFLWLFLLGFCMGLCTSRTWVSFLLSHLREAFIYNLFKCFLRPNLFVLFFWDLCNSNTGAFSVVPVVSETVLISYHSFICLTALWQLFLPVYFPSHLFALLLQLFCYWFLLVYFSFQLFCCSSLFFSSSRSSLNISCILTCAFIFFPGHLCCHYSFSSSRLPASTSLTCFSGFLSC